MGTVALCGLREFTCLFNEFKLITFTINTFFLGYHSDRESGIKFFSEIPWCSSSEFCLAFANTPNLHQL